MKPLIFWSLVCLLALLATVLIGAPILAKPHTFVKPPHKSVKKPAGPVVKLGKPYLAEMGPRRSKAPGVSVKPKILP